MAYRRSDSSGGSEGSAALALPVPGSAGCELEAPAGKSLFFKLFIANEMATLSIKVFIP